MPINILVIQALSALAGGATILCSQYIGSGNRKRAENAAGQVVLSVTAISVALTAICVGLRVPMLNLIFGEVEAEVMSNSQVYFLLTALSFPFIALYNCGAAVFRAQKNTKTPMAVSVISNCLNVAGNAVLIYGMQMGVAGAALATILAQLFSGLCCVVYVYKYMPELHVTWQHFRMVSWKYLKEHLLIAFPIGFQNSIIAIGGLILQNGLNSLGSTAIAAYVAAQKLDALATLPAGSLGIAVTTYVAQNYGAQKYNRIRQGIRQCAILSISYSVFVGALMLTFGGQLASLFLGNESAEVLAYAKTLLSISGLAYWALYLLFVYRSALQGLGHKVIPTVAGIMELIMRASSGLFLIRAFGFRGACFANPLAWFGSFVPLVFTYYYTIKKIPCD